MAPLELEGDTLGKKHQNYNKLVNEASKDHLLQDPSQNNNIQHLLNIDIACKYRNVDYILEVLKSEDELYVSKAIKRSTWLITDPQYAHIINPEHLYMEMYPQMTTKAFNKLMLQIRLHLRDEKRVESFYSYIKEKKNAELAYKWLQHCSVPFVEVEVMKHNRDIPDYLVIRLFEKSFTIFEAYHKNYEWMMRESIFLVKTHTIKYLDFIESSKDKFYFSFSAKDTEILMQKCPQRIIDQIEFYGEYLDIATFAKYLNKTENIKEFLIKHSSNDKFRWLYKYDKIQHFIKMIPKESRFEFVKKLFIDKDVTTTSGEREEYFSDDCFMSCALKCSYTSTTNTNIYQWYKFAPFELAFTDLKKMIRTESLPDQRTSILQVLLSCAGRNAQNLQAVLQYYCEKHINEPFKFKIKFVNSFISRVDCGSLDDQTWAILNKLFHSMEVFIESENNVPSCIQAIIVRNVVHNKPIPEVVEKKFVFDTLKQYEKKLKSQDDKDAVFKYLQNYITTKGNAQNLALETEFCDAVFWCETQLKLIKDWGKELHDYPNALARIKELIKVKKERKWNRDFKTLYKINKSWRKTMFELSVAAIQNEAVCMNALKHDPELLSRSKEDITAMCRNDSLSLKNLLRKIRIYWPVTLAEDWKTSYVNRLNEPNGHKALVNGLCTLLSKEEINDILKKYAPSNTKIDWNETTDQLELSLRKQIAKNIHKTRPLPAVDAILPYAKGDYLQFAVPSLDSILSQLSPNKSRHYIPILLDAPVSLQKFGVRCAFHKMTFEELKPMLFEIWNSTKNSSIRTVLFTLTYQMLCKEKSDSHAKAMWELLNMFIDKLTTEENKQVYSKLSEVSKVPDIIKPMFFMKSYTFLNSLPAKCNCERLLSRMQNNTEDFIGSLDENFVVNVMLKKFLETFGKEKYIYDQADVVAKFILSSKDEDTQIKRYEMSLAPLLEKYLPLWEKVVEGEYRYKDMIQSLLEKLADNQMYTFKKKMQIPLKVFKTILLKLENSLDYKKDYLLLTTWKLTVEAIKTLVESGLLTEFYKIEDHKDISEKEKEKMYTDVHKNLSPLFSRTCVQILKDDIDRFGHSVYTLFSRAYIKLFDGYYSRTLCMLEDKLEYALGVLRYDKDKEVWLMVHHYLKTEINDTYSDNEKKKIEEIREIAFSHPSDEVKMHYYNLFSEKPPLSTS